MNRNMPKPMWVFRRYNGAMYIPRNLSPVKRKRAKKPMYWSVTSTVFITLVGTILMLISLDTGNNTLVMIGGVLTLGGILGVIPAVLIFYMRHPDMNVPCAPALCLDASYTRWMVVDEVLYCVTAKHAMSEGETNEIIRDENYIIAEVLRIEKILNYKKYETMVRLKCRIFNMGYPFRSLYTVILFIKLSDFESGDIAAVMASKM